MANKTRTVAGHKLTLTEGVNYRASRPMADRNRKDFPVTIEPLGRYAMGSIEFVTICNLDYEASNRLLSAFNNSAMSFDGRIW
jgi:hypothetical protein